MILIYLKILYQPKSEIYRKSIQFNFEKVYRNKSPLTLSKCICIELFYFTLPYLQWRNYKREHT